ncbi:MAG: Brp/Blh family beta-carotene 15,15'-dioxygenase [Hyphomicrobium aestuarii]|nr:Brp/Blh family beta-carotene 15,15'-dioxygenase [Hyphomicrobium aestuarii]
MIRTPQLPEMRPVFWSRWSALNIHRGAFIAIAAIAIAGFPHASAVSLPTIALIAAPVILLLGVPHGAFDVALSKSRWPIHDRLGLAVFLAAYIGIALLAGFIWWMLPGYALAVFLAASAYHFAGDWCPGTNRVVERTTLGVALLSAPTIWYAEDVTAIFGWLAPAPAAVVIATAMAWVAIVALALAAAFATRDIGRDPLRSIEIGSALSLGLFCPPVVFFTIYFCGLHAPRHILAVRAELKPASMVALARASLPYAPLAILGILLGALLLTHIDVGANVLAAIFLGLAVLTAPHMALIDLRAPK